MYVTSRIRWNYHRRFDWQSDHRVGNDLLKSTLQALLENGNWSVLLNVVHLTQVDSSSVAIVVSTFILAGRKGGDLKILCPRGSVQMVLRAMRLLDRIPPFEDEVEALTNFA